MRISRVRPIGLAAAVALSLVLARARVADAQAAQPASETTVDEGLADGTFDADDLTVFTRLARGAGALGGHRSARTWLSLVGFAGTFLDGRREAGALAVVSLAFDRLWATPERAPPARSAGRLTEGPAPSSPPAPAEASPREPAAPILASPALARAAVGAAWRVAGLGGGDARIDAIVTRARLSAILPEARLRAMRSFDERSSTDVAASQSATGAGSYYDATGAKLWLEARLTWRLDRLLYADEEPTFERIRMERQEARARVASRVLELQASTAGSRAELEATLRAVEAEAALDIVTGGWFSSRGS
jgi:hypothetical protein